MTAMSESVLDGRVSRKAGTRNSINALPKARPLLEQHPRETASEDNVAGDRHAIYDGDHPLHGVQGDACNS